MTLEELTKIVDDFAKQPFPTIGVPFQTMQALLAVAKAAKALRELDDKASKDVLNPDLSGEEVNAVYTKCIEAGETLDKSLSELDKPPATDAAGAMEAGNG